MTRPCIHGIKMELSVSKCIVANVKVIAVEELTNTIRIACQTCFLIFGKVFCLAHGTFETTTTKKD